MEANLTVPLGFRFLPSDEELVIYYLRAKLLGQDLPPIIVEEKDLYEKDPELYVKDQKYPVYFFTQWSKRKEGTKSWRDADQTFADVTTQIPITYIRDGGEEIIGWRRTLIYFNGEEKTNLRMHEYIIPPGHGLADLKSDMWILCKIFRDVEESDESEDEGLDEEGSDDSEDEGLDEEESDDSEKMKDYMRKNQIPLESDDSEMPDVDQIIHWHGNI